MDIVTADQFDFEELHELGNDAFSDYVVPAKMTAEQFNGLLSQRGFVPDLSFVAVEKGRPLSYWHTGLAPKDRPGVAYSISVGTRPEARRRGLSRILFEHVAKAWRAAGCASAIHEVITTNTGAVKLYEALGYRPARTVKCYGGVPNLLKEMDPAIEEISIDEAAKVAHQISEWQPAWQNDFHAMRIDAEPCMALAFRQDGLALGYAILVPPYGQITQLAVSPDHRRQGIATRLLCAAWAQSDAEKLGYVNVDEGDTATQSLLQAAGLAHTIDQYDMRLAL